MQVTAVGHRSRAAGRATPPFGPLATCRCHTIHTQQHAQESRSPLNTRLVGFYRVCTPVHCSRCHATSSCEGKSC